MSAPLEWKDPPETALGGRGGSENKWRAIGEQLRANPGQWAVVDQKYTRASATALASRVRRGRMTATLGDGRFEAAVSDDNEIFVRYLGGTS